MFNIRWQPVQTKAQLDVAANPASANQPEALPWFFYDSQDIVTGVTTALSFFTTIPTDPTISNMKSQGQLPDPQYFVVHYVTCDLLQTPTLGITAAVDGALTNIEQILKTARATFTINLSDKLYGPFPLTLCHATGGATGVVSQVNNTAAPTINNFQQGNNGMPGSGGFPILGALVIPPKVGFSLTLNFGTAPTLTATVKARMGLAGVLYRRVL